MAKCVRVVGQGMPVRMTDDDAFQIVERDKDGQYCTKRFWKQWWDKTEMPRAYGGVGRQYNGEHP